MSGTVFPYRLVPGPPPTLRPLLQVQLANAPRTVTELALVDSGSDVNVLPYYLGTRLGLDWNRLPPCPSPVGALAGCPARAAVLDAAFGSYTVRLAFLWVQRDDWPLILGQVNFFLEFDVCFFRSRSEFQIQPRTP